MIELAVTGRVVAEYVIEPDVDPTLSPRPYLHPVQTLGGVVVSDVLPDDHRHHLGVSIAVQDVAGTNLWGGKTYVRDVGYTWRDDHGRIAHDGFDELAGDRLIQRLRWCDHSGATLLRETRALSTRLLPGVDHAWVLDVSYTLTAPADRDVVLGSPATNGRPGKSGYGGFFWRAPAADVAPRLVSPSGDGEDGVNGSTEPWLALTTAHYGLIFTGLAEGDHWFARAAGYPGVCAALAFERTRTIPAGARLTRRHAVVVADGRLERDDASALAMAAQF
jgi:hypothetical protein